MEGNFLSRGIVCRMQPFIKDKCDFYAINARQKKGLNENSNSPI
jgi:hypothetical protein